MASRTSSTGVVNRGTSGGDSFYVTDVDTLDGTGIRAETYRTDGAGKNRVLIRTKDVDLQGNVIKDETSPDATIEEQREFLNKKSTLRKLIEDQVNSAGSDLTDEITSNGGNAEQLLQIAAGGSGNVSSITEILGNINLSSESVPLDIQTTKRRTEYELLYYPENIAKSKQDRIVFGMRYISGQREINFNADNLNPLAVGKRNTETITGSVTLPIPGGISDKNSVKFEGETMDMGKAIGAGIILNPTGAASAVGNLLQNAIKMNTEELQNALNSEQAGNIISALRLGLAQSFTGGNLISRLGGGILNPNMELLFQAPTLRSFSFSFTMSARSRTEATQIKKIIRFFKQGMSVKKSNDNIFVLSPNIFTINYKTGDGREHPSIGRIKPCALLDLNTTYGNGSTYMTYDDPDRTLTQYKIDMSFQELDPITEDDYHAESTGPSIDPDEAFKITSGFPADHIGY